MKLYDWPKAKTLSLLVVLSLVIGVFVGSLETLFGKVLLEITAFRGAHFLPLVLFLTPVGMLFVDCFHRFGQTSVQGMGASKGWGLFFVWGKKAKVKFLNASCLL